MGRSKKHDRTTRPIGMTATGMTGRIMKKMGHEFLVAANSTTHRCVAAGRLNAGRDKQKRDRQGRDTPTVIAVGDEVLFEGSDNGPGRIVDVLPRRNTFARRAAGPKAAAQVVAANVDQLLAVFAAAEPSPHWAMLDRYLVIAEAAGIPAVVCVTKIDLIDEEDLLREMPPYGTLGYPVLTLSSRTGSGLEALCACLAGRCTVLAGKSGVGKTSLLNALGADLALPVGEVGRKTGKGRHTTTCVEAFAIPGDGLVIDTPGARELGLWDIEPRDLAGLFPEMRPLLGKCRFGANCGHTHEDGCAVKAAAREGVIHPHRYRSYLKMYAGESPEAEHVEHSAAAERKPVYTDKPFACARCGWTVSSEASGTRHRNHCPHCLWSVHVDVRPGDRSAACNGPMEPIAVWVRAKEEWAIVHRCEDCGGISTNRVAGDDNEMKLMSLAVRPLAQPPFPLDGLVSK